MKVDLDGGTLFTAVSAASTVAEMIVKQTDGFRLQQDKLLGGTSGRSVWQSWSLSLGRNTSF